MKQFLKFGVVGSIGFIVDALLLLLLVEKFYISISISRFFSFLVAVFVTWILNRIFTFSVDSNRKKKQEYIYYLVIQSFGAIINYIIFISLVFINQFFEENLIVPLAIASIIAMFFNFFMIKNKIYNS